MSQKHLADDDLKLYAWQTRKALLQSIRRLAICTGLVGAVLVFSTCEPNDPISPPGQEGSLDVSVAQIADSAAVGSAARRALTVDVSGEGVGNISWWIGIHHYIRYYDYREVVRDD